MVVDMKTIGILTSIILTGCASTPQPDIYMSCKAAYEGVMAEAAFLKPALDECERARDLRHPSCRRFAENQDRMVNELLPASQACSEMGVFPFPEAERQEYIQLILDMLRTTRKIRQNQ